MWRRLRVLLGPETARNFLADAGASGLFAIFQGLTAPFIAVLAVARGAVPWEVGWLTAAPAAALLLSSWYARLFEGRRQVPVVVWSTAMARLLLLVTGWTRGMSAYLLSYTGFNIIGAASSPAYTAVERAIYHERWRGQLMGGVKFVLGLCQFVTTLVAGQLLDRYHAGPVFTVAVLFGLASAAVFALVREPQPAPPSRRLAANGSPLQLLRQDPAFRRLILALTLAGGANFFVGPGYPIYWVHRLHLSDARVAWITAAWSLAWMVLYPLWGRLCDRRRPADAVLVAMACYLIPPLCYTLHCGIAGAVFAGWAQGAGDSALDVGWQNYVMRLAGERIGAYAGAYLTFLGVRGTVMPVLGALLIARWGLGPLFPSTMAMVAAGLVVARGFPEQGSRPLAQRLTA